MHVKTLVGAFNQEKALVGAFYVIVQPVVEPIKHYTALILTYHDNDDPVQGMEDLPPDFATIPPESFDTALPRITLQDLETLRAEFPNIAESLSMPDRCWCSNSASKRSIRRFVIT